MATCGRARIPPFGHMGLQGLRPRARGHQWLLAAGHKASRVAWAPGLGPVEWAQANRQLPS
jgi:hypothetical protein